MAVIALTHVRLHTTVYFRLFGVLSRRAVFMRRSLSSLLCLIKIAYIFFRSSEFSLHLFVCGRESKHAQIVVRVFGVHTKVTSRHSASPTNNNSEKNGQIFIQIRSAHAVDDSSVVRSLGCFCDLHTKCQQIDKQMCTNKTGTESEDDPLASSRKQDRAKECERSMASPASLTLTHTRDARNFFLLLADLILMR